MTTAPKRHQSLKSILNKFQPTSLAEMDAVKLLNRQDTKFVVTLEMLLPVLEAVSDDYRVLEIENIRLNSYETLYYDTHDLKAYRRHHNSWSNRYKVRFRKYMESDLSFFEIKFKSNKNRTVKTRIIKPDIELNLDQQDTELLSDTSPLNPNKLLPRLWVYFKRITLVNKDMTERMTIDLDLQYANPVDGSSGPVLDMVIIEVKQPRFSRKSPIIKALRRHKIFPFKVSKYCIGIICCYGKKVKTNSFKRKLIKISKITKNDYYRSLI